MSNKELHKQMQFNTRFRAIQLGFQFGDENTLFEKQQIMILLRNSYCEIVSFEMVLTPSSMVHWSIDLTTT